VNQGKSCAAKKHLPRGVEWTNLGGKNVASYGGERKRAAKKIKETTTTKWGRKKRTVKTNFLRGKEIQTAKPKICWYH